MPRPQHTARSGGAAILPARSTGNLHNSRHKPRRAGKGDARAGTALHPGGTLGGAKLARSAARVTIVVFLSRLGSSRPTQFMVFPILTILPRGAPGVRERNRV